MSKVLLIACILALSQNVLTLVCPRTPVYNETIATLCAVNDTKLLWPNYENVDQYFICPSAGNPVLKNCLPNTIFDFSKQNCTKCNDYVPAPPCQTLKGKSGCKLFKSNQLPTTTLTASFCGDLATYSTSFVPTCVGRDIYMFWPNYKNVSEYYWCQAPYDPKILSCSTGTYFNYYGQSCTDCFSYVAAPICEKLPFDKTNRCKKI